MKVEQVKSSKFTSNTYYIDDDQQDEVWLVDIGEIHGVLNLLKGNQYVKGVFITHPHYDHIFEINTLVKEFPDCLIFSSKIGKEGLYSSKLNLSRYHNMEVVFEGNSIQILKEKDRIELFKGHHLEVLETPGHDWSCLSYHVGNYLFTGDSFIPYVEVVTKLRGGDRVANGISLKKIRDRFSIDTIICPGHGDMVPAASIVNLG